ncbi:putative membrane protein YeiH [Homoserinimonas aerilata]|uniref:Putative membrane protein YeiH n=1 Tax=Homoserinimonas aerilata TaxID=1162970 RepID=A0A542YIG2_9MICO|nr:trimeric intracellular cation channel family protein [Homoserinimonas aerilata]TQL47801.1 putative membrane protein YeiH [Homoserinimonas aerilata]
MDSTEVVLSDWINVVDLAGVLGNAVLGGIAARAARLDIVGFIILAILSGLGGGIIRDTLLQRGTPVAFTDPLYLYMAILGAVVAFFISFTSRTSQRMLILLDALAVGCWAAAGTQKALVAGLGWLPAIILGMVTAIGGGMVRDVFLMKVPTVFGGNTLYATSAFVASIEMVVLSSLGLPVIGSVVAILSGAALSLLARRFGWILPTEVRLPHPNAGVMTGWLSRWWSGARRPGARPGQTKEEANGGDDRSE